MDWESVKHYLGCCVLLAIVVFGLVAYFSESRDCAARHGVLVESVASFACVQPAPETK